MSFTNLVPLSTIFLSSRKLYHAQDALELVSAHRKPPNLKYFALNTLQNREFVYVISLQPCLAKSAKFVAFKSLNHKLPSPFNFPACLIPSHPCHFSSFLLHPHQNPIIILWRSSRSESGSLK